ncbi:hypothetical protein D5086_021229 [Populus alba]|uniref:Uncharacterized protein n=1 Tax=Populus alba TaxID=43335 RepID=A0ACC4BCF2_POPAL
MVRALFREVDEEWNGLTLVAMWSFFDLGPELVMVRVYGGYGRKGSGLITVGVPRFRPRVGDGDGDGDGCLLNMKRTLGMVGNCFASMGYSGVVVVNSWVICVAGSAE